MKSYKIKERFWLDDKQPEFAIYKMIFFRLIPWFVVSFNSKQAIDYLEIFKNYKYEE